MTNDIFTNYHCIFKIKVKEKVFQFIPKTIFRQNLKSATGCKCATEAWENNQVFPQEEVCPLARAVSFPPGSPLQLAGQRGVVDGQRGPVQQTNQNLKQQT